MAANIPKHNHIFYDNVSTTDETETCVMPVVADESTMNLEIISSGSFSAKLMGSIMAKDDENFKPYPCFKLPSFDLVDSEITDDDFLYQVDITALDYVKIKLISLSGTITIRGRVVG